MSDPLPVLDIQISALTENELSISEVNFINEFEIIWNDMTITHEYGQSCLE